MQRMEESAYIAGELAEWPSMRRMASLLRKAGLQIRVGSYSIRVLDCSHFVFQEYGGDLGDPQIDADADSVSNLMREAKLVSDALAAAKIRHRFEVYVQGHSSFAGYLHYDWPAPQAS